MMDELKHPLQELMAREREGMTMGTRSIAKDSATYMPNVDDRKQLLDIREALSSLPEDPAKTVDSRFAEMAAQPDFPVATLKVPGRPARPLTPELANALLQVADQLARGKAVFVAPYDTKLTTQDAADFLGVSRPTLVKLLEQGKIPFEKVGRHRRVLLADLQRYAEARHQENLAVFDGIAADENPQATLDNPLIS